MLIILNDEEKERKENRIGKEEDVLLRVFAGMIRDKIIDTTFLNKENENRKCFLA